MNRRKFLGTVLAAGAALLAGVESAKDFPKWFGRKPAAPALEDPLGRYVFPVPNRELTPAMIREAWNLHRPGKPFRGILLTDAITIDRLVWAHPYDPDLRVALLNSPARFDIVQGLRVKIEPRIFATKASEGVANYHPSPAYLAAPFQDHILLDDDQKVCELSTRRVLPFDGPWASAGAREMAARKTDRVGFGQTWRLNPEKNRCEAVLSFARLG